MVLIENFGFSDDRNDDNDITGTLHTSVWGNAIIMILEDGKMEKKTNQGAFTKGMFCMDD